jgi:hypothetical protein
MITFVKENYMYAKIEIYQLKAADHNRAVRFQSLANFTAEKGAPSAADYDRVYECTTAGLGLANAPESRLKEEIFRVFNIEKPADFKGHSLSVSDVVVLDGAAYYVDVYGFKRIENFKEEKSCQ